MPLPVPPVPIPEGMPAPLPPDVFEFVEPGAMEVFTCPACRVRYTNVPRCPDCRFCIFDCNCRQCQLCSAVATVCAACLTCPSCCRCRDCVRCHRRRREFCAVCDGCRGHCCQCFVCSSCGTRRASGTPRAGDQCIECASAGFFFFNVTTPKFHEAAAIVHRRRNRSARYLSGEIEVSSYNTPGDRYRENMTNSNTARAVWKWGGAIVGDGSVRGGEINTAPAAGDKWLDQISEICEALEKDRAYIDTSAGGHLHVDARDFSFYDMRRFVFLYEKIEGGLFGLVNPTRRSNHFCARVGNHHIQKLLTGRVDKKDKESVRKENKAKILTNLYGREPGRDLEHVRDSKSGPRYYACNLHSWMHRGSIECRLMQGSVNPDDWHCWGMLWAGILDYAMKRTEKDILALSKASDLLLTEIAPNDRVRSWISWSRLRYGERVVV